jgi:hypothetical protein
MSWRAFLICLGCGGALACGSTSNVTGDDGGGADGSQASDATVPSDAEGGGWQGPDATGSDTGSVDGNGSSDAGPSDSSGAEVSSSADSGGSDATDASDGGGIIIVPADSGDDGPGAVEGGATTYFPCGPTATCKTQTQFCFHTAGPRATDGSFPETWDCVAIPAACEPAPTCTCLAADTAVTNGCPCSTPQVGLEVDCLFP